VVLSSVALESRVVGVHNGDTLKLLAADQSQTWVRRAAIDAPESSQSYGVSIKRVLSARVFGRTARVVRWT
jgi:endonuclease YncB( thermonuclease family)